MPMHRYRYTLDIYRGEHELIDQAPALVDWDPALEAAWLQGLRLGQLQLTDGTSSSAIRPLWHPELGEPYISGFCVTILAEHSAGVSADFTTDYFKSAAAAVTRRLLEEGRLERRDGVRFLALAFFDDDHAGTGAPASRPFRSTEVAPDLAITESSLADFTAGATYVAASRGNGGADDIPIFVPRRVMYETRDAARATRDRETGGILIGHLRRDTGRPELFVEVTAQIPVTHAPAEVNKLTFTPETWTAAQAAIDLRRSDEIYVGWWHSHPVHEWCKDCPPAKKEVCPLAQGFLSSDDCQLHRTVFPRAYTCALVVSDIAEHDDVVHSLFGWRRGAIESRGYHLVGAAPEPSHEANSHTTGGN